MNPVGTAQWRTVSARDRLKPVGFILPCQPVLEHRVPKGPDWIHELKWDGIRILARKQGSLVRLWSRNGRNWSDAFPAIVAAVTALPFDSLVIDGEAVCLQSDGRPDFHALRSKFSCREARLIAFDLLNIEGGDIRQEPLYERRRQLATLLNQHPPDALWFSANVDGTAGESLFR
jgi:bifunctional non-homologous end joining protein LigD